MPVVRLRRVTSDGHLVATIWDVAVLPIMQRSGLGSAMIERLMASLVEDGIPLIALYAEPGVVKMYKRFGFVEDPEGCKGVAFQKSSKAGRSLYNEAMGLPAPAAGLTSGFLKS